MKQQEFIRGTYNLRESILWRITKKEVKDFWRDLNIKKQELYQWYNETQAKNNTI